jgi:hypothetical protein
MSNNYYNSDITKDAFYREKVSTAATIADIKHIYDNNPNQIEELLIGNATSIFNLNSYIEMKVYNQNDKVIRQSKEYYIYQSGKSKSCLFTGVLNMLTDSTGFTSRIGCFDDHNNKLIDSGGNGVFFELTDNILYVVLRYGSSNQTDIRIPQSQFSHDKLDGNGPSKLKLTKFNYTMIYQIDFQWLGSGIIRYFIHFNGKPILIHIMPNTYNTVPYMKSGDLPIRYEIQKNTNNTNIGEMRHICSSIQIESGYNLLGFAKVESILSQTSINANSSTLRPIFSIKLKNTCVRSFIKNFRFNIINTGSAGNSIYVAILLNPIFLPNNIVWNQKPNSIIQYSITSTTITNLATIEHVYDDYIQGQTNRTSYNDALTELHFPLTSSISGISDIFTVCVAKVSGNATLSASFNWLEYH